MDVLIRFLVGSLVGSLVGLLLGFLVGFCVGLLVGTGEISPDGKDVGQVKSVDETGA